MMSPDEMRSFGARLRALREARKLSRDELGRMLGEALDTSPVTGQTIYRWERGLMEPESDKMGALAAIFNVSKLYLTHGIDETEPEPFHDLGSLSDEDLAIEGVRRDEARDGRELTDAESSYLRETFRATQLSIGAMSSEDAIRDLKLALRRFRAGVAEDYSRPSTPARDRLLGRKTRKRG